MSDLKYNGRLFFPNNINNSQYELFEGSNEKQNNFEDSISTLQELSPLSKNYFSKNNIDKLQNLIINQVRIVSNNEYNIGRQSDTQLQIIMRSIYLTHSKNLNVNIGQQINELNQIVVDEAVKQIIPHIKQYLGYLKDITTPRTFMNHPKSVSSKGDNSLGSGLFGT